MAKTGDVVEVRVGEYKGVVATIESQSSKTGMFCLVRKRPETGPLAGPDLRIWVPRGAFRVL